jgi:hypothetical protein
MAGRVLRMGTWVGEGKQLIQAEIELKYACHCYTESSLTKPPSEMWSIRERSEWRVFDVPRHSLSVHIPRIVEALVQRPNKQIQKVSGRHNYKVFQLGLKGVKPGEKYYVFLKLEKTSRVGIPGLHQVRLSVESAYPKDNIVAGNWRPPFGTAIEEILGLR